MHFGHGRLCRKDSLLHRILAHMDAQFRTRREMLFDVSFTLPSSGGSRIPPDKTFY